MLLPKYMFRLIAAISFRIASQQQVAGDDGLILKS